MKKTFVVLLLVGLVAFSGLSFAATEQVSVYMLTSTGAWGSTTSEMGEHARAFKSGGTSGACDKEVWTADFTNHMTVSQWIDYSFSETRWDWQIRKWGTFAADCISFKIQSNDDVMVSFAGFGDLQPLIHTDGSAAPIKVWYSFGEQPANGQATDTPPTAWYAGDALPNFTLPYALVKDGVSKKLWNKIEILQTTRACDYENKGQITFTLTDVKYFIDKETGLYNGINPGQQIAK